MHAEDPSMSSHQVNGYAGYANGHSNLKYRTREVNGNAGPKGDGDHVPHPFIYRLYPTTLDKVIVSECLRSCFTHQVQFAN